MLQSQEKHEWSNSDCPEQLLWSSCAHHEAVAEVRLATACYSRPSVSALVDVEMDVKTLLRQCHELACDSAVGQRPPGSLIRTQRQDIEATL